jgi:hypothetical protein
MSDFDMYTEQGKLVAQNIVNLSRAAALNWPQTLRLMQLVAAQNPDLCGELTDTAVREMIYSRCEFTTPFYA